MLVHFTPTQRLMCRHAVILMMISVLAITQIMALISLPVLLLDIYDHFFTFNEVDFQYYKFLLLGFVPTRLGVLRILISRLIRDYYYQYPAFRMGTILFIA